MNLYAGLLFQGGYIADPKLAVMLAKERPAAEPATDVDAGRGPAPEPSQGWLSRAHWLLEELTLLGGRPVTRDHLDDLDEPFPTLHPCR